MELEPLGDRILIKPIEVEEKTVGGIFIPNSVQEKSQKGEVLAVGPGRMSETGLVCPMFLKRGHKVLYSKYGGVEFESEGETLIILSQDDVLAIIRGSDA